MEIEKNAMRLGAVAVGVCSVGRLIEANAVDLDVLPSAKMGIFGLGVLTALSSQLVRYLRSG